MNNDPLNPISVVIPTFEGRALLRRHLPAVDRALRAWSPGGEIVVVDDGSRDGTGAFLEAEHPEVRILVHEKNRGFRAACETGVENARHELVLLLNSDVEPKVDCIAPLVRALADARIFAAGSVALRDDGETLGEHLKIPRFPWGKLRYVKPRGEGLEQLQARLRGPTDTLFVTGGFMAFRRKTFLDLGGFDPLFEPFYFEDADLCYRAWKRGFRCVLVPDSVVIHRHEKGTIHNLHGRRRARRIQARNRLLFLWKNLTDQGLFWRLHGLPLLAAALCRWVAMDGTFYRGLAGALMRLPRVLEARRGERARSTVTDGEILSRLTGRTSSG